MIARQSVLPPKLPYGPICDRVISFNLHLCWTTAEAWEMTQLQVCHICRVRNMPLFYEIARSLAHNVLRFRQPSTRQAAEDLPLFKVL